MHRTRRNTLRQLGALALFAATAAQAQSRTLHVGVRGGVDEEIWRS